MATGTAVDVVMPQMGVSVSEGTITKWLKSEGDPVAADEPLLEISTDKVDTEVPAPASGVLGPITVQEGETVEVGTTIATILPEGTEVSAPTPPPPTESPEPVQEEPASVAPAAGAAPAAPAADEDGFGEGRAFVSPVVARIAGEHDVNVSAVPGTGRGGRVTKKDILDFIEERGSTSAPPAAAPETAPHLEPPPRPAAPPPPPHADRPPPEPTGEEGEGEVFERMSVMRKAIAEHMVRSIQTSAHVTTIFEIDMSRVVAIREKLKKEYADQHGVKLTFLPFIARAVVDALGTWPRMNAEIRGDQIVTKSFVNLGIAVALDDGKGLIVPVIHNAEEKNLLGITRAIGDLADRARTKKLLPDDVQGGTFTITNPGGFGAIGGTPIINQPQVGILDVDAIVKRPVVLTDEFGNDSIAIRPMMNLCLSYDHRLIDGAYAAPFMRDLKISLETWDEGAY